MRRPRYLDEHHSLRAAQRVVRSAGAEWDPRRAEPAILVGRLRNVGLLLPRGAEREAGHGSVTHAEVDTCLIDLGDFPCEGGGGAPLLVPAGPG